MRWILLWRHRQVPQYVESRKLSSVLTHRSQVRGGLTFREGHYICEAIYETGLLVALDLMVSVLE